METDHTGKIRAAAGEFENRGTTETETDRGNPVCLQGHLAGLGAQGGNGFADAGAQTRPIGIKRADLRTCLLGILRPHAFAIHVGDEDHVIAGGHFLRTLDGRFGLAHPVRHHDQTGTQGLARVVVDQVPGKAGLVDRVADRLDHHRGLDRGRGEQQQG